MSSIHAVKREDDARTVKAEPAANEGAASFQAGAYTERPSEDVDDDDQGDLDMKRIKDKVWLVKMPKFLAEKWANIEEANVDLGWVQVNQYEKEQSLQLILPKTEANADVPLRYDLSVTNRAPMNSYIFEETLFPLTTEPPSMESGGQGSSVPDSELSNRAYRKFKRQQERRRKMALVGTVAHECTVTPIVDATYRQVMTQRQKLASQPKRTIKMIDDRAMQGKQSGNFSSFIRSNTGSNKVKGSGQDGLRNARLPHDELLDLLFECFEKYEYWPLRSLREHLKQPEAYLKEVLETIAFLQRRGPYDSMWSLKPEYKSKVGVAREALRNEYASNAGASSPTDMSTAGTPNAGQGARDDAGMENEDDDDEDDDNDDIIMEDVISGK